MDHGTILPAESDVTRAQELVDRHLQYLRRSFSGWGSNQATALAHQKESGALSALLWKSEDGRRNGLVWVQHVDRGIRVHGVWLDPSGPASLATLLRDLERTLDRPVLAITDILPGLDPGQEARFFAERGFWHRAKVLMRYAARAPSGDRKVPASMRPVELRDLPAVTGVYVRAYSQRPGEFWTWGAPDAWAEAERDVRSHVGPTGAWAPDFVPGASFVWEEDRQVVGAVLVSIRQRGVPYVEDLIVEPTSQRRGIGRALLVGSIDRLERDGSRTVELAAIQHGAPYRTYLKVGFKEVPPPEGRLDGHWVRGSRPF